RLRAQCRVPRRPRRRRRQPARALDADRDLRHPGRDGGDLRRAPLATPDRAAGDAAHRLRPALPVGGVARRPRRPAPAGSALMTVHDKTAGRRVLDLKDPSLLTGKAYVAGDWVGAPDGRTFPVTDPVDGALIMEVPDLGPEIARRAIDAAQVAQKEWAKRPVKERSQVLRRWYERIVPNGDDLALSRAT